MTVRIITGDALEQLRLLPEESVHCVVMSPPYWGLRDYGVAGQIGIEPDFREYIETMVAVFREVRRILRNDGTLWLNLGDSYVFGAGTTGLVADRLGRSCIGIELNPEYVEMARRRIEGDAGMFASVQAAAPQPLLTSTLLDQIEAQP